jgi:2',3'-cyclic-nucleotide 2'-phosphodiesterase (5'-nucleotidase family)
MTIRLLFLLVATLLFPIQVSASSPDSENRSFTVLAINDVYRMDNLPGVRTLRKQLEEEHGEVLLLHAGDFLFPSLLSRSYDGQQMVDVLNLLDGDDDANDPLMFLVMGNHEFDKRRLKHAPMLKQRMDESQFTWLNANVDFKRGDDGKPMVASENIAPSALVEINGIKVGIFGITTDVAMPAYVERIRDYAESARTMTGALREQGAEVVIGLTHLTVDQDKQLFETLGDEGPDLIFGGHEHTLQAHVANGRTLLKADADALTATIAHITPKAGTRIPAVDYRFQKIPGEVERDTAVNEQVKSWQARYQREYCAGKDLEDGCLEEIIGKTNVELEAEELVIRRFETNLGNWVADHTLEQHRAQGAQVAFINSGSLRLNRNIPADSGITRKTINELFAYANYQVVIRIDGKTLQQVVDRAIEDWTGNGHWLQISGFAYRHNPEAGTADMLSLITPDGPRPVRPDEEILAVTNYYLIDQKGDRDGYTMLNTSLIADPEAKRPKLVDIVVDAFLASKEAGVAPEIDGRICNTQLRRACVIDALPKP